MEVKKAQSVLIICVAAVIMGLAVYSQSGVDPESKGFSPRQGLKALVGGYGHAAGSDPAIIMTPSEDW